MRQSIEFPVRSLERNGDLPDSKLHGSFWQIRLLCQIFNCLIKYKSRSMSGYMTANGTLPLDIAPESIHLKAHEDLELGALLCKASTIER